MELLVMLSFPLPCYLFRLRSANLSPHPILEHPQPMLTSLKIHCLFHKTPPPVLIRSQTNQIHKFLGCFFKIHTYICSSYYLLLYFKLFKVVPLLEVSQLKYTNFILPHVFHIIHFLNHLITWVTQLHLFSVSDLSLWCCSTENKPRTKLIV